MPDKMTDESSGPDAAAFGPKQYIHALEELPAVIAHWKRRAGELEKGLAQAKKRMQTYGDLATERGEKLAEARATIASLRGLLGHAVLVMEHEGPLHPGHQCGADSPCDGECVDYARHQEFIQECRAALAGDAATVKLESDADRIGFGKSLHVAGVNPLCGREGCAVAEPHRHAPSGAEATTLKAGDEVSIDGALAGEAGGPTFGERIGNMTVTMHCSPKATASEPECGGKEG